MSKEWVTGWVASHLFGLNENKLKNFRNNLDNKNNFREKKQVQ